MTTLLDRERETYTDVWHAVDQYGELSPGANYVPLFLDMAGLPTDRQFAGQARTVLDAGCGSGKGAQALVGAGFSVTMADVTAAGLPDGLPRLIPFHQVCLWEDLWGRVGLRPGWKFDYVYCCDVLEHVPLPLTMLVVARLLAVAKTGVFLSVCLQRDVSGLWVGKPLHQSVQSFVEWRDQLSAVGRMQECRDLLHTGLYYVVPR